MADVFEFSEARGNDRLVLLAIADEADDDGSNAYPSINRLAEKVRLPKRTVMRCLLRLEELGELEVERPETNGRGHFNRYRVLLGKGDSLTPEASAEKGRAKARKGAPACLDGDRPIDPLTPSGVETDGQVVSETLGAAADAAGSPEAERLCAILAALVAVHREGPQPAVTATWRRDMRLLMERGPLGQEEPEQLESETIERAMRFTFDRLAERGRDGFCWADQVRSPGALRRHYHSIRLAAKASRESGVSRGGSTVQRVATRLQGGGTGGRAPREPLGLLPGPNEGRG